MAHLDYQQARYNMVEQQVRPWEVLDERVLETISGIAREDFVLPQYQHLAYTDIPLPLPNGQRMMEPKLEARMMQSLMLEPHHRVLEIGTGSGYVTTCLARLSRHVISMEYFEDLSQTAGERLQQYGVNNVELRIGDAMSDLAQEKMRFDAIAVTGSVPMRYSGFERLLKKGGRLFVIVGTAPIMEAVRITRSGHDDLETESLFDVCVDPLIHAEISPHFIF